MKGIFESLNVLAQGWICNALGQGRTPRGLLAIIIIIIATTTTTTESNNNNKKKRLKHIIFGVLLCYVQKPDIYGREYWKPLARQRGNYNHAITYKRNAKIGRSVQEIRTNGQFL